MTDCVSHINSCHVECIVVVGPEEKTSVYSKEKKMQGRKGCKEQKMAHFIDYQSLLCSALLPTLESRAGSSLRSSPRRKEKCVCRRDVLLELTQKRRKKECKTSSKTHSCFPLRTCECILLYFTLPSINPCCLLSSCIPPLPLGKTCYSCPHHANQIIMKIKDRNSRRSRKEV